MRMLCLWWPDWPVEVARRGEGTPAGRSGAGRSGPPAPVVVIERGCVRSASVEARAVGVRLGLRRREAEARCPGAVTVEADLGEEGRVFEVVADAMEALTPKVAIERPGLLFVPTRGPSRRLGGDPALAGAALEAVRSTGSRGAFPVRVGVADGAFAARLAARIAAPGEAFVVAAKGSEGFLAPWPVGVLEVPALASLLVRLGLPTLGSFASLSPSVVVSRFGVEGRLAHRRARGLDDERPAWKVSPPDLVEGHGFEPPTARLDVAIFVAKTLADRLHARLSGLGLACNQVLVEAESDTGELRARSWRGQGGLGAGELAERVRWQLEVWMAGEAAGRDPFPGGLSRLRLIPEEVVTAGSRQLGFWGAERGETDRAGRALARLQGVLGPEAVLTAGLRGGRTPLERIRWSAWAGGVGPEAAGKGKAHRAGPVGPKEEAPWPGTIPPPAPALVFDPPLPAELLDATGVPVTVSARGESTAPPARLRGAGIPGGGGVVEAWAGPWAQDLRWWDGPKRRRRALWQVVAGGVAHLVATEGRRAFLEATYD